jgi:hypothetical protein
MSEEKKGFYNLPKQKAKEQEEAEKIAAKEAEIQPVIEKEIEEVIAPTKPMSWWIQTVLFWGMLTYIVFSIIITPIARGLKYTAENGDVIQYMKDNADEVKILRQRVEEQTAKAKGERKSDLCSKVVDQTKECDGVKPLPTNTPTPTVKIVYPTP